MIWVSILTKIGVADPSISPERHMHSRYRGAMSPGHLTTHVVPAESTQNDEAVMDLTFDYYQPGLATIDGPALLDRSVDDARDLLGCHLSIERCSNGFKEVGG